MSSGNWMASKKAARKAADDLARIRNEQMAGARVKMQERAGVDAADGLADAGVEPSVQVAVNAAQ
jgi:hypothetical protein